MPGDRVAGRVRRSPDFLNTPPQSMTTAFRAPATRPSGGPRTSALKAGNEEEAMQQSGLFAKVLKRGLKGRFGEAVSSSEFRLQL